MILNVNNLNKHIGLKVLYEDLSFSINEGEKVALIGRNGLGKTTLFNLISGKDTDFSGQITVKSETRIIATKQEHDSIKGISALEYILENVPRFLEIKKIFQDYEKNSGNVDEELEKMQQYSDAISDFYDLGYFTIEDKIISTLENFGVSMEKALNDFSTLSGGEKRFVELTNVMYSRADLALIDEPTNHMDYVGKDKFIEWLDGKLGWVPTMIIVTHDRDVLKHVDRILEIKDKKILSFPGNYDSYLKQNSVKTTSGINEYEAGLRQLEKLKKQINEARVVKLKAKDRAARIREENFQREYDELKSRLEKPSFWIDQESKDHISDKVLEKYEKYKDRNIAIQRNSTLKHKKLILRVRDLSLGYNEPLFKGVNFEVNTGDRVFIKGRNGAGKTTLIKSILNAFDNHRYESHSKVFEGLIDPKEGINVGFYEQEINPLYLAKTLKQGIFDLYHEYGIFITDDKVNGLLGQYLFNPITDGNLLIKDLSGGQKARFQIIKMLASNPSLLILDEPTNHLDLPSVEVLETALTDYNGAIIYISHDQYFINKMGGEEIKIEKKD